MRRPAVLAFVAGVAAAGILTSAAPANAHICAQLSQIPVGQQATVHVGIAVEQHPVSQVDISLPAGLRLDEIERTPGWTTTRTPNGVTYRGKTLAPYSCADFPLGVTALEKNAYAVGFVLRDPNGKVVAEVPPGAKLDDPAVSAVYAGVKPPQSGGGTSTTTIAIIVVSAVVVGLLVVLAVRSWRRADDEDDEDDEGDGGDHDTDDRDAELRDRMAAFKEQTEERRRPQ